MREMSQRACQYNDSEQSQGEKSSSVIPRSMIDYKYPTYKSLPHICICYITHNGRKFLSIEYKEIRARRHIQ